ncbi:MAG: enoyl-CoA hydratase-related protein [Verrucomicrobiota bacterium]
MKPGLQVGLSSDLAWPVDPSQTITLGGEPAATVFATPSMVNLMEHAAREVLRPFLEDGEESVGVDVEVKHLAPTPLGANVRAVATVTGINGRTVSFDVLAFDHGGQIGSGKHRRAIIQLDRFIQHVGERTTPGMGGFMRIKPDCGDLPAFQSLKVEVNQGIATVTLNRPAALNAINAAMTQEMEQLAGWLAGHGDLVRVVIVTGAGRAFCAGDDAKEVGGMTPDQARALSLRRAQLYLAFETLPQPFIAAVNGHALGGGCVCAYSCDFRVASHGAVFGMPEITLGWAPGYGVAQLTALVGKARALELCLTGRTITARQALDWGLVHEVVSGSMLLRRARQLADRLLEMPPMALRETKRLIHADEGALPKLTHRAETEAYVRCFQTEDAREGVAAFKEKRKARFKGR